MTAPITLDGAVPAQVLNGLRQPIVMIEGSGTIAYANSAAEDFFRTSAAVLARKSLAEFLPFGSPVLTLVQQATERQAPVNGYRIDIGTPKLGSDRIVDIFVSPLPERPGTVVLMLQERSVADMIDRQMTHRGAARSVTGLAAMLAHEIKNPLAGIRGAAQLLAGTVDAQDRELTRLITDETDRIVGIVDRMEMFADNRPLEREPVNIHVVLDKVKTIARNGFARDIRFIEDYDPSLPPVHGNAGLLVQAFVNLVKNAAEALAGRPGGEILLSTAYRPGIRITLPGSRERVSLPLQFSVADNGPGIPDDLLPILFDPFITTRQNGSGLGLALVAKIVRDHGGVIECDSHPRHTVFRILMPDWRAGPQAGGQDS